MVSVAEAPQGKKSKVLINVISVAVPLVVIILLSLPNKLDLGVWTQSLKHVIGGVNTLTTFALILGLYFIKSNNINAHRLMMSTAFSLGGVFLICYVLYHLTNPANKFTGEGIVWYVYIFLLMTHIGLSFVVLPLVLRAMFYAATKQFAAHKKIVKFAYPIWLYVSVSGVIVYLMLYQLFPAK
jgi:putative membrane protein